MSGLAAEGSEVKQQNTGRRDLLLKIQAASQKQWEEAKIFEAVPPEEGAPCPEGKFFGNFPYPYMNGLLHLGHAFSLSKLEFAAAYHRLCGKRVLFAQGFHCTGMPIKACADKLDRELSTYGIPPVFPTDDGTAAATAAAAAAADAAGAKNSGDPTKFVAKKSKAAAKKGTGTTQWQILKQSGIPEEEIPLFRDPTHWLQYFPPLAERDMRSMGCGVDWRRSFITTDLNPYYDSFIRWQFDTLHAQGRIVKDKRFAVFSPLDDQPCADHDRASGEGVGPQEYTLVKMRALELPGKLAELAPHAEGGVYLLAATLRPETMYGQTNCWVLPEGQYGAFRGLGGEVWIVTERSALNLSYQEKTPLRGRPEQLMALTGQDLIGTPLAAPNCPHPRVYVLPLLTILTNKGTGVVTSVPSDSPDDYMALQDLKNKPKLREKFGVADEWVLPFEVLPIIDIPGLGDMAAPKVCADLKIQSQNDSVKLAEAKQMVYLKGFTEGVLKVGPHAGTRVADAKPRIREEMLAAGQALLYSEPEKTVMSRSGDECVVALTDQWYLTYGEDVWRELTEGALADMELYSNEARHGFEHTLGWLQQWACSRSYGLGSRLPWDPQYLIESLSDSTIYMAYYTVAHVLQNGDMYGQRAGAIPPEHLTNEVWDYILLHKPYPEAGCAIPEATLAAMRSEFEFWYPFDLRVSGKDLIQNHLTFALYTHTAMWPPRAPGGGAEDEAPPAASSSGGAPANSLAGGARAWPRAYRTNGHLLLNSEKMSKSTGNFKTLAEAIAEYSADAMRWALADAGDAMDDANFETTRANAAILRMTKELAWAEEMLAPGAGLRTGDPDHLQDRIFSNAMDIAIAATRAHYEALLFREALKAAAYDLGNARDVYRFAVGEAGMHAGLVARYVEVSALLLAPITPHTCDHVWRVVLGRPGSVLTAGWPAGGEPDYVMERASRYIEDLIVSLRKIISKLEAPPKKAKAGQPPPPKVSEGTLFVARRFVGWQEAVLRGLQAAWDEAARAFGADAVASALDSAAAHFAEQGAGEGASTPPAPANSKALKQLVLPFTKFKMEEAVAGGRQVLDVTLPFDEAQLLADNNAYLLRALGLSALHVTSDADLPAALPAGQEVPYPGNPTPLFTTAAAAAAP